MSSKKQPPDNNQNHKSPTVQVTQHQSFSGPLPPPSILENYNRIDPSFAERIVAMAEEEGRHRRQIENASMDCKIKHIQTMDLEAKRGQIFALIIVISALILAGFCAYLGAQIVASIIFGSTMLGIVSVFILGRSSEENNDD